jgi:hypothetical protein
VSLKFLPNVGKAIPELPANTGAIIRRRYRVPKGWILGDPIGDKPGTSGMGRAAAVTS